jgi:hypothetical protein
MSSSKNFVARGYPLLGTPADNANSPALHDAERVFRQTKKIKLGRAFHRDLMFASKPEELSSPPLEETADEETPSSSSATSTPSSVESSLLPRLVTKTYSYLLVLEKVHEGKKISLASVTAPHAANRHQTRIQCILHSKCDGY